MHERASRLAEVLADADALNVRNRTIADGRLLDLAPRLRAVGRVSVGLDNRDLPALRERGATVTWAPGTNAVSVSEYVIGCMLELGVELVALDELLERSDFVSLHVPLADSTGDLLGTERA